MRARHDNGEWVLATRNDPKPIPVAYHGYDSEAAFARAFKRLVGKPPATWRRAQRSSR